MSGAAIPRGLLPIAATRSGCAAAISVSSSLALFSSAMMLAGGSCPDGGLGLSMIQYYTTSQQSVRGRKIYLQYSSHQELIIDQSCHGRDLDQIINGPRGAVESVDDKFEVFYIDFYNQGVVPYNSMRSFWSW